MILEKYNFEIFMLFVQFFFFPSSLSLTLAPPMSFLAFSLSL